MQLNVQYLEEIMKRKRWSTRQLAIRSGLTSATVSRIISGKRGAGTRSLTGIRQALPDEPIEKLFILK